MRLSNAMPAVCSALGGNKFLGMAAVETIARSGPRNGSSVLFEFRLLDEGSGPTPTPPSTGKAAAGSKAPEAKALPDMSNALFLVSCVKSKHDHPAPAQELYTSTFFRLARGFVAARRADWRILSALHGLLEPEAVISPYERTLKLLGAREKREWAARVLDDLLPLAAGQDAVVFLAGKLYREDLVPELVRRGVSIKIPMQGLRQGEQLAWLKRHQ